MLPDLPTADANLGRARDQTGTEAVTSIVVRVQPRLPGVLLDEGGNRLSRQRGGSDLATLFDSAEDWGGINRGVF